MAVHRNARRLVDLAAESDHLQTEELVERYGNQWLATARRSSPTAADAEDAYQRALETLLTSPPEIRDPEQIAAWMHTVVRNEALQIVRSRKREVDTEFEVIVGGLTADVGLPDEAIVDAESHAVAKEALRRLRPDQTRCLLLRADGFDYPEICKLTGFSYAKVNRLLSEGRKAARVRVDAIVGGRECERLEPLLSMFADGEADGAAEQDLRLHLETCAHCRATLRDYKLAPRDVAALLPVGLAASPSWSDRLLDPIQRIVEFIQAKLGGGGAESSLAVGKKALAAVAVGATAVGGGAAIHDARSDKAASPSTAAPVVAPPIKLLSPVSVPDRHAERRRRARAVSRRAEARSAADTAASATVDPRVADDAPALDTLGDQTQTVAPDPQDTKADPAAEQDQGGVLTP